MPKTLSKALFSKLLRSDHFHEQMNDFHHLSGMECLFLDQMGRERLKFPRHTPSPLREAGLKNPELAYQFERYRQSRLTSVHTPDLPWIELIQSIKIDQELIGYWVLSACRDASLTEDSSRAFWSSMVTSGLDLRWTDWYSAWIKLPVLNQEQQQAWGRVLQLQSKKAIYEIEKVQGVLPKKESLPPMILSCCEYVQAHYMETLHLKDLADRSLVCPEHLSRVFHQSTGLRFRDYLAETRINAACAALTESTDPISQIAGRCGFSTLSRFNTCFKTHTGMTPSAWRKRKKRLFLKE